MTRPRVNLLIGLCVFALAFVIVSAPVTGVLLLAGALVMFSLTYNGVAWIAYFAAVSVTGVSIPVGGASLRVELLGLLFLLLGLGGQKRMTSSRPTPGWLPVGAAGVYLGILLISSLTQAPEPDRSVWILAQIASGVLAAIAVAYRVVDVDRVVRYGNLVIGALSGFSVIGFLMVSGGIISAGTFGVATDGRLIGFSIETNIFAAQVVCWLAVVWATGAWRTRSDRALVAAMCLAVVLAGTRSAWIAGALVLAVAVWSRVGRSPWVLPTGLACAGAASLAPLIGARLVSTQPAESLGWRLGNIVNISEGTGAYRFNIYETAIQEIGEFPRWIIGSGVNSYSQFHLIDATNRAAEYLGNFVLATLYDGGVVALLGITVLLISLALAPRRKHSVVVLLTVVICASVTNIVWFQFAWLYLGLAVAHGLLCEDGSFATRRRVAEMGKVYVRS